MPLRRLSTAPILHEHALLYPVVRQCDPQDDHLAILLPKHTKLNAKARRVKGAKVFPLLLLLLLLLCVENINFGISTPEFLKTLTIIGRWHDVCHFKSHPILPTIKRYDICHCEDQKISHIL